MATSSTVGLTEGRASGSAGSEYSKTAHQSRDMNTNDSHARSHLDTSGAQRSIPNSRCRKSSVGKLTPCNNKSYAPSAHHSGLWRNGKYGRGSFNTEGVFTWSPAHGSDSASSISFDGRDLLYVQIKGKCNTPISTDQEGDEDVATQIENSLQEEIEMHERVEDKGRKGSASSLSAIDAVLTHSLPPAGPEIYLFEVTYANTKSVSEPVWTIEKLVLGCVSQDSIIQWVTVLQDSINAQRKTHRPSRLLVFINPYGGRGYAESIYKEQVRPLLSKCSITVDVVLTTHANHARDVVNTTERLGEKYDGVVVVGGDGLLSEIINGILTRTNRDTIKKLRIGIIPAGSTNCVLYSAQGGDDVTTAVLQIVLGSRMSLDLGSVWEGKRLKTYFASMGAYGFFGDVVHMSENHRWMGPARYDFSGFKTFMKKRAYRGKVFLRNTGKRRGHCGVCRIDCPGCDSDSEETSPLPTVMNEDGVHVRDSPFSSYESLEARTQSAARDSAVNESQQSESSVAGRGGEGSASTHIHSQPHTQANLDGPLPTTHTDASTRQEAPLGPSPDGWEVIEGDFICVNATIMSCRCPKSPNGMSPHGHLSDGCIDLILVRNCNRAQYLAQLTCLANPTADHLSFDFVEFTKVTEFYFVPSASEDKEDNTEWVVDGEPLGTGTIHCQVHSNLIHLFQRRPLTLHKSKPNLIHKASEQLDDGATDGDKKKLQPHNSQTRRADASHAGDGEVESQLEEGSLSGFVGSLGLGMCMSPGTAGGGPVGPSPDYNGDSSISPSVDNIVGTGINDSSIGASSSRGVDIGSAGDGVGLDESLQSVNYATLKVTPSLLDLTAEDASVILRPPASHLIPAKREDI
ncbi:hypothetical protein SARC_02708 [Sphaeroforma arctica JP610]|uniref:DAGKc domain-containing protein n=1 Tax=Sphaeroforma arctica JP610 TaxID=667725 RepID=A0A0L0G7X6_9EUKA|nr:hypothetical protein SARC_02708 [Sphaeroforma arctica JP610]KNC85080.1 hypothetical protein SARC_02708 [Sphaeroforma arctica JP610]|eukprot:XP_014158982.1 hypothetical protein SARC_02708 [Sphaeroforma arctica JP610]